MQMKMLEYIGKIGFIFLLFIVNKGYSQSGGGLPSQILGKTVLIPGTLRTDSANFVRFRDSTFKPIAGYHTFSALGGDSIVRHWNGARWYELLTSMDLYKRNDSIFLRSNRVTKFVYKDVSGGSGGGRALANGLSPLFSTTNDTTGTNSIITHSLLNSAANTWFGNAGASSGAPSYNVAGVLTRANDVNVTLTLGGTPNSALLKPVSMQLGWIGTLSISRGGLGMGTTPGNHKILMGNGTGYSLVDLTPGANVSIDYDAGSITINASGTSSGGGGFFIASF